MKMMGLADKDVKKAVINVLNMLNDIKENTDTRE